MHQNSSSLGGGVGWLSEQIAEYVTENTNLRRKLGLRPAVEVQDVGEMMVCLYVLTQLLHVEKGLVCRFQLLWRWAGLNLM